MAEAVGSSPAGDDGLRRRRAQRAGGIPAVRWFADVLRLATANRPRTARLLLAGMVVPPLALSWALVLAELGIRAYLGIAGQSPGPALAVIYLGPVALALTVVASYLITRSWTAAALAMSSAPSVAPLKYGDSRALSEGRHTSAWRGYLLGAFCLLVVAAALPYLSSDDTVLRSMLDFCGPTVLLLPVLLWHTSRALTAAAATPHTASTAQRRRAAMRLWTLTAGLMVALFAVGYVFAHIFNALSTSGNFTQNLGGFLGAVLMNIIAVPVAALVISADVINQR